jgi:hypothetical protein
MRVSTLYRYVPKYAALAMLVVPLSACAPSATISASRQTADIQSIQVAEQEDLNKAYSPSTDPTAQVDLYSRAVHAKNTLAKLEHGVPVTEAEIDSAATVPDVPLSEQRRAQLLQQLSEAKKLADRGAYDHDDNPILTEDFIEQGREIDNVTQNLEAGVEVPQYDIQAALHSPAFP